MKRNSLIKNLISEQKIYKNDKKSNLIFKEILNTPSISCNNQSKVEMHTLVSHFHLNMYILAIKSFLRFYKGVSVVVHDDGTLNKKDKNILKGHIPQIKIIDNDYANEFVKNKLKKYSACSKFRNTRVNLKQIFDFNIFAKKNKIIMIDSDTLFIKRPKEIINWIKSKEKKILHIYERSPDSPRINKKKITSLRNKDIPFRFTKNLCCGFVCYYKDIFNLKLIKKYCNFILKNCDYSLNRYRAQPIIALCIENSQYISSTLPKNYQNISPYTSKINNKPIFRHYFFNWHKKVSKRYIEDGKLIISKLKKYKLKQKFYKLPIKT